MFLLLMFLLRVCASFLLPPSPRVLRAGVIEVSRDQSSSRTSLHWQKTPEDGPYLQSSQICLPRDWPQHTSL